MGLPFIDLAAQQARIRDDVDKRIAAVLNHGAYILGPEVKELEAALAERCGATHVISCSSGTDALILALLGLGLDLDCGAALRSHPSRSRENCSSNSSP